MIVLRAATSHSNRRRCGNAPIDPASSPPRQIFGIDARCFLTRSRSMFGSIASSRDSSSLMRASRNDRSGHERITPALINSSRSTFGTTRTTAQSYRDLSVRNRLLIKTARRYDSPRQVFDVGVLVFRGRREWGVALQPLVRHELNDRVDYVLVERSCHRRIWRFH